MEVSAFADNRLTHPSTKVDAFISCEFIRFRHTPKKGALRSSFSEWAGTHQKNLKEFSHKRLTNAAGRFMISPVASAMSHVLRVHRKPLALILAASPSCAAG